MVKKYIFINIICLSFLLISPFSSLQADADTGDSKLFDARGSRAFQVQTNITGVSNVSHTGNFGAGIHVGYQLSPSWYLGMTSQFFSKTGKSDYDRHGNGYDEKEILGQEGVDDVESFVAPRHLLQLRYMPWSFGLYFSGGIMYNGEDHVEVKYKKRKRTLDQTEYNTGLEAELDYDSWVGPAAGIGFNHIFANGLSLGVGIDVGLTAPQKPDVKVKAVNSDSTVSQSDLDYWKDQIEDNEKRYPHMAHFSIGYAF